MKIYANLIFLFSFIFFGNSLFAQAKEDPILRNTILISQKKHTSKSSKTFIKIAEEANDFSIENYLAEHIGQSDIRILGDLITYKKRVKLEFDSKEIEPVDGCSQFCKKIVSIEKIPLLGLVTTPMDDLQGVLIETVVEGSAADLAGINQGDVITNIGDSIVQSGCDMNKILGEAEVDQVLDIHREDGETKEIVPVVLGYKILEKITYEYCCPDETQVLVEENNNRLVVFPNPTDGLVQFRFNSSSIDDLNIQITDIAGHKIHQSEVKDFNQFYDESFDLTALAAGVYFLQVVQGAEIWTEKIVLQKM